MLENLRKKQKIIIILITIAFVVGMAIMGLTDILFTRKPVVGKINGVKITYEMFQQELQQNLQNYRQQNPDTDIEENLMQMLVDQTWQRLQQKIILDQQVRKMGIRITDNDILNEMQNNPPQELMVNPSFQTSGRFDRKKYLSYLKQDAQFFGLLENYYKESLPFKKLMEKVKSKANITLDSLKADYLKENDEMQGKVIWFNYNKLPRPEIADAEIKTYYDKNKDTDKEIKKGKASAMKFLTFEIKPDDQDYQLAKAAIDELYDLVVKGEDFEQLARTNSDDPGSAARGGSLGEFGKGQMVPAFENVVFTMDVGEISKPFKTDFGWHFVRLDSIGTGFDGSPKVKASHILKKVKASQDTRDRIFAKAVNARKLIKSIGIEKAAEKLQMKPADTDAVYEKSEYVPGIGKHDDLFRFLIKGRLKAVSKVEKDMRGNYIVAQITMKRKEPYEPFEKAKLRIKYELEKQKKVADLKAHAESFVKNIAKENYLTAAEKDTLISIIPLNNFKTDTYMQEAGKVTEVNKAALALDDGQYSQLINTKDGQFIVYCEKRVKPDVGAFLKDSDAQKKIKDRMEEQAWNRWYDTMMKKAKIVDNRKEFSFY